MKRKQKKAPRELQGTILAGMWLALFPLWQDGSYLRITKAKWNGME